MIDKTKLPVWQHRQEIVDALNRYQVIVVESPTGSGKTTQIPLILKDAGYCERGCIGITQPRRIATLSVCDFIKKQIGDEEGTYVGYKMRFTDTTASSSRIKIMTDGILLMELKTDPKLLAYSVIVVDEAHERSLNIDFILGMLKGIIKERPDFRVIISSATINTKVFSAFFDNCPIISITGRVFPVQVYYRPDMVPNGDDDKYSPAILRIVKERKGKGDILVFLPGEFDITRTVNALYMADSNKELVIYPLYARLSKEEQESVFTPTPQGKTKVVVATNIAETSVTIDGITTVIDCGVAKMNFYNQSDYTSRLIPLPVSKSSAEQRKGRAGRTQSGVCYRLYGEKDYDQRFSYGTEEILRTDLSEVVLRMSDLGLYDYEHFPFITRPKQSAIISAEKTLRFIGAIDTDRHLTKAGELMCKFPLPPRLSRVVVESMLRYPDVLQKVLVAVAFLSCRTPFLFPAGEEEQARAAQRALSNQQLGDFVTYLQVYNSYTKLDSLEKRKKFCNDYYFDFQGMQEIVHVVEQLGEICGEIGFPIADSGTPKEYLICIASGLVQYVCRKEERNVYRSLTARSIFIHPGSAYFRTLPEYIIAGEIVETSRLYARSVSPLQKEWLDEIRPGLAAELGKVGKSKKEDWESAERKAHHPVEGDYRQEQNRQIVQVYRRTYPTVLFGSKKRDPVAVIPYKDLPYLASFNRKAAKKPRNFRCTVDYQGYYIHYGDKFFSILELADKIKAGMVNDSVPKGTFTIQNGLDTLVSKLDMAMALVKSKKMRNALGFIALDAGNNTYRFTYQDNFFDALDTTLYALGELRDSLAESHQESAEMAVEKKFNQLLKLAD